jgi:hypothetical protein
LQQAGAFKRKDQCARTIRWNVWRLACVTHSR